MADIQSNINVNIDADGAAASLKNLQRQISAFHSSMAKSGAAASSVSQNLQSNLLNTINRGNQFAASMKTIKSSTEAFTTSLEKNKLSMGQYFRYAGASTKSFGRLFSSEFNTIEKVARERVKTLQTQYIKMGRDANGAIKAIAVRPLALDMKSLATQTAIAAQKQQIFNQLMKQGSTNLLNFGKNTQWAGRQLMVGFTVPLVMLGTTAAKTFMEMEKQVIRFKRVYGEAFTTGSETDKMAKDLQMLAKEFTKYGVAVSDTMSLAADAAAMGKQGAELTAQVAEATRLAVLGGVEQAQALETTISLTNAFGISADQLANKINFLNSVENQTVTSIEDLTVAIPKAGPVIQQLGGDVEDLAFFLTAMKEGGINASEGANALKSGLASMINPTAKASEFLAGFGINLKGIVEANKGDVKGTIVGFAKALDTLDPLNRAQAIEQLFGKFQFARLSTLFQNVVAEGSQATKVLELSKATAEELAILSQRELKRVEDSPMFKFQKAIEDIKTSLVPLGEAFLKAVTPIIEFGSKILEKFNKLDEGTKGFVVGLVALLGAIGPIAIMSFGLLANGVANLVKGFMFVKNVFSGAGRSSKELGSQLGYMTQEQLEAASVAASLDQVHNKLTQTFSSEASAISNLAAAYQKAIAAQQAFTASGAARGPVRRMASGGIVNGPGTGTSDSVPAMLSAGEAVIPAAAVKKNPGMVAGLISGNIPGYKDGIVRVGGTQSTAVHASHFEQLSPQNLGKTISRLGSSLEGFTVEVFSLTKKLKAEDGYLATKSTKPLSSIANSPAILAGGRSFAGTTIPERSSRNLAYEAANIGGSAFNLKEVQANGKKAAAALASQSAESVRYSDELKILVAEAKNASRILSSKNGAEQEQLAFMRNNAKSAMTASLMDRERLTATDAAIKAEKILAAADADLAKLRTSGASTQQIVNSAEKSYLASMLKTNTQYGQGPEGTGRRSLRDLVANRVRKTGPYAVERTFGRGEGPYSGRTATAIQAAQKAASAYLSTEKSILDNPKNDPYVQTRNRNSPHAMAGKDGKDDADAYVSSRAAETKTQSGVIASAQSIKAPKTGPLAPPVGPKVLQNTDPTITRANVFADKLTNFVQKIENSSVIGQRAVAAGDRFIAGWQANVEAELNAKNNAFARNRALAEQQLMANNAEFKSIDDRYRILKSKLDKDNKLTALEQEQLLRLRAMKDQRIALAMEEMGTQTVEERSVKRRFRNIFARRSAAAAEGAPAPRAGGGKLMGASMAASGVLMAASMVPGKVGETAQSLMMPVMALTMILPMLSSGLGAAVVAIGLIAGAAIALKMQFDSTQDAALKLSESMGVGKKAIQSLAKFAGKVTAGEVMDKRRKDKMSTYQIQTGKKTFGQAFIQAEEGKSMLADTKQSIAKGGKANAQSQMINQMVSAVASGALSAAQAKSIVENLALEMGDTAFGINVNAKLNEVLGPNGENLLKDPLQVRMNLMEDTRKKATAGANSVMANATQWSGKGVGIAALGGLAGAGAGALTGAAIGAAGGPIGAGVGALLGAVTGIIAGGIVGSIERSNRIAEAGAVSVGLQKQALEQQQEMIDSLDLSYQKRIEEATAAGDQAEAERLTNEYIAARPKLLAEAGKLVGSITTSYQNASPEARGAMDSGADKAIDTTFKGTANEDVANLVKGNIKDANLTNAQDYTLRLAFSTGDIDPTMLYMFLDQFGQDKGMMEKTLSIMTKFGGAFASDSLQVMNMFVDKDGKPMTDQQTKFIAELSTKSAADAEEYLNIFLEAKNLGGEGLVDLGVIMSFYNENPGALAEFQKATDLVDEHKGKMSMKFVSKVVGAKAMAAVNKEAAYFNNLSDNEQKVFTKVMANIMTLEGDPYLKDAYQIWLSRNGFSQEDKPYEDFAVEKAISVTEGATDITTEVDPPTTPKASGGGGGGKESSVLDDLLRKLKEIRKIQVKVTEGWKDSANQIKKYLGGNKNITVFQGIKQQMRALGSGEDLIELIVGMDPEEYEKRKNELFEFDKNGNIVKLKDLAKATGKALQEIALGEFQNSQQQIIKNIGNQNTAFKRLIANGMSVADAYAAIEDAAFAAAVANKKLTDSELKKITKEAIKAAQALRLLDAAKGVSRTNEEIATRNKVIAKLSTSNLKDEERKAILDSPELQELYLQRYLSKENNENFVTALENAVNAANFEINENNLTIEGLEKNFQTAFDMAMERINAQETKIELEFEAKVKDSKDLIEKTQNEIEDYNFKIDDLEASLKPIEEAEKLINEQYEERIKALDKIAKANETLTRQQKQQLSVADAITQGDIAAAARAVQDARAQEAQASIADQKEALEANRDLTLAGLVNAQGLTRLEVETQIKDLKNDIFKLEEDTLEPAQRFVELEERKRDAALATYEAQKATLELLKNNADIARTNQPEYVDAADKAKEISGDIVEGYKNGGNVTSGEGSGIPEVCKKADHPISELPRKTGYTRVWDQDACKWTYVKGFVNPDGSKPTSIVKNTPTGSGTAVAKKPMPTADAGVGKKWTYNASSNTWSATSVSKPSSAPFSGGSWTWNNSTDSWTPTIAPATKVTKPTTTKTTKPVTKVLPGVPLVKPKSILKRSAGGLVPQYLSNGGDIKSIANSLRLGTDTIPAMLTPGEFVVRKSAVDSIGLDNLVSMNKTGTLGSSSVYNYDISINVRSESNANEIADTVLTQIKRIDSQRLKGNRLNAN